MATTPEIDVGVPFDSVKAAVNLFGRVVSVPNQEPSPRASTLSSKSLIGKERQLFLAQKELEDIKQKLEKAKKTRAEALAEHERGKQTVQDLTTKLKAVTDGVQYAIAAEEDAKRRESELSTQLAEMRAQKRQVDVAREQAKASAAELNAAKEELEKIRLDFDTALEEEMAAFQKAAEAQHRAKVQSEKACEVSTEITAMKETLEQLKSACEEAEKEEKNIEKRHNVLREAYLAAKAESDKKLQALKKEYDPELMKNLKAVLLAEAANVAVLEEELKKVHTWKAGRMELKEASFALRQLTDEEQYLRKSVSSLTWELQSVREEQQKELCKLLSETENARHEAEEINRTIDKVKQEAERARVAEEETRRKLEVALRAAEEAKAAKKKAFDRIRAIRKRK